MIYTSTTLALAALEYLIHVEPENAPADLVALTIEVPDDAESESVAVADLPTGWERATDQQRCREIGDAWLLAGRTLVLRVPAAPVPEEENVLLNPRHPDAPRVRVVAARPFYFDPRLLG